MPFSEEVLRWVRKHLDIAANDTALEEAYAFEHAFQNPAPFHSKLHACFSKLETEVELFWSVTYLDGNAEPVTEQAIARSVFLEHVLVAGEVGRVALNGGCFVREPFRRQGFAGALYAVEEQLYRRWGVQEIQLNAMKLGVIVWPRLGFSVADYDLVASDYRSWAEDVEGVPPVLPREPRDYPEDFLRALADAGKSLYLYKVLT